MARKRNKEWTAVGAARAAREMRISTTAFLRDAPIAKVDRAHRLMDATELHREHLGGVHDPAVMMLFTGLGYPETWHPEHWYEAAETVIDDEAAIWRKPICTW
jgi:hypothetical protein